MKFYFTCDIERASGWQRFFVEASTLEEAKRKQRDDPRSVCFDDEDVEVTALGPDNWEDE